MTISIHQYLCLTDNYGALVHDSTTGRDRLRRRPGSRTHARGFGGAGLELNRHLDHPSSRRSHPGRAGGEGKIPERESVGPGQGRGANSFPRSSGEGRGHGPRWIAKSESHRNPRAYARSYRLSFRGRRTSPSAATRCFPLVAAACSRRPTRSCGARWPSLPPFPARPRSTAGMNTPRRTAGSPSPSNPTIRF